MGELHWRLHCQDGREDSWTNISLIVNKLTLPTEEALLMPQGASGAPGWQARARCDVAHVLGWVERTDFGCLRT